jgi:hypothetical protein
MHCVCDILLHQGCALQRRCFFPCRRFGVGVTPPPTPPHPPSPAPPPPRSPSELSTYAHVLFSVKSFLSPRATASSNFPHLPLNICPQIGVTPTRALDTKDLPFDPERFCSIVKDGKGPQLF